MAHMLDKVCQQAWDVYNRYQTDVGEKNKANGRPLFPSSLIEQSYEDLFKIIKSGFPDKAQDLTIIDIASFILDASKYLEGHHGFIARPGLKVGFLTDKEYDKHKNLLISIPDNSGFRKYELIGIDDLIVYHVKSKFEQFKVMINYMLLGDPQSRVFYFRLGSIHNILSGYQVSHKCKFRYLRRCLSHQCLL